MYKFILWIKNNFSNFKKSEGEKIHTFENKCLRSTETIINFSSAVFTFTIVWAPHKRLISILVLDLKSWRTTNLEHILRNRHRSA